MYLVVAHIRERAHEQGKRVGDDFLARFNAFVERKLEQALSQHNGGKKTLDASVADFVLGSK